MLGLFDSGLGGLTVLRHVRALLPEHDLVYLADTAHVPYGDRTDADLLALLRRNVAYLERSGAQAIVMACNTSCAVATRHGWPASRVPILDLIASAAAAIARSGAHRIGVVATSATVRSGAYARAIARVAPHAVVEELAAPELVPLVEAGDTSGPLARAAVERACAGFDRRMEALVLACTHYPILSDEFAAVCGPGVTLVDPGRVQADAATRLVAERNLAAGTGRLRYVTTGDPAAFARAVSALTGDAAEATAAHMRISA